MAGNTSVTNGNGSNGTSPSPADSVDERNWTHFCQVLRLGEGEKRALESKGIDSLTQIRYGVLCDKPFEFDDEGILSSMSREKIQDACEWLRLHLDTTFEDSFRQKFTTKYEVEVYQKRKRDDEKGKEEGKKLKTAASQLSASNFVSDSKKTCVAWVKL